ncbi:16S rRNA (cytidine(1402)-2'-O)-methyltransferase [Lutibaculum baratangense]|uniref:Ribosomal RNA small subunit methyltransferase I n=1 Tax=Lutibaculum baratangense AMV1 TaxID=631454 RepID=V4TJ47_9HYPH|nr:16S rRNA (cytidine(1402)-2'-O)-methyltransferase [Lutibaculum baratangense]ESR25948.1 rRNA small subunit methyltransferase I [Lutibaculum baratangense AMV1]
MTPEHDPNAPAAVAALLRREARPAPGLYIVATPIGNLADITLRALAVLAAADVIACEDTRVTRKLAEHFGFAGRLLSAHEHNEAARAPQIMAAIEDGKVVALVSDAGTPLLSDPGYRLVGAVLEAGHEVHAVPGPSALLTALVAAGLPTDRFWFEGFLPTKAGQRRRRLEALARLEATAVVYESPRRIAATLRELAEHVDPDRRAVVSRELTKRFEETRRGTVAELAAAYAGEPAPKGEIVLMLAPAGEEAAREAADPATIDERLEAMVGELGVKEAASRLAAETGLKRRDLYQRALKLEAERQG